MLTFSFPRKYSCLHEKTQVKGLGQLIMKEYYYQLIVYEYHYSGENPSLHVPFHVS